MCCSAFSTLPNEALITSNVTGPVFLASVSGLAGTASAFGATGITFGAGFLTVSAFFCT
ncbi:hypothetical protein D3C72_2441870 [compost metagenome]